MKKTGYPLLFLAGMLLLVVDHTGHSVGDRLFGLLGIPAWLNSGATRWH